MKSRRRLLTIVAVGILLQILVVLPALTMALVLRQNDDRSSTTTEICQREADDRTTLLDLIDYATRPSDLDPAAMDNPDAADAVRAQNKRATEFRAYAHNHLPPIDC